MVAVAAMAATAASVAPVTEAALAATSSMAGCVAAAAHQEHFVQRGTAALPVAAAGESVPAPEIELVVTAPTVVRLRLVQDRVHRCNGYFQVISYFEERDKFTMASNEGPLKDT